jgi:hypothetical protein
VGFINMEKSQTLLKKNGQDMADAMSPAQRAEAKKLWDAISSEGLTEENALLYQRFCSKTYGMVVGPVVVTATKPTPREPITFRIQKKVPQATEFVLFMLPRERREDVFSDLNDWYPSWCEKFGTRRAKFLCWWHVGCCVGGAFVDVVGRVGEIIDRVVAAK